MKKLLLLLLLLCIPFFVNAQSLTVHNPILPGFNPDPSICAVGEDYYLVTSSFEYVPGLPVYHSRDLVHWELISHAIDRGNVHKFHFEGINDNDGVWAPTIRYHDGTFYISSSMWRSGGNFVITAKDPHGPWSDPVYIPDAPGIDPTLFWDDDGKAYYVGNRYDFTQTYFAQVAIFIQEIDLGHASLGTVPEAKTGLSFEAPIYRLVGGHTVLTYGHAANAKYAEGPHLYKIDGKYYLLMAEGGSGAFHAVTAFSSDSLRGPYEPQQINPVLSHRQMGRDYPIQNIGHADLFTGPGDELYAVCLGNRMVRDSDGGYYCPLGRETFLTRVEMQDGQLVFAPGVGYVQDEFSIAATPCPLDAKDEPWYGLRGFPDGVSFDGDTATLTLRPEVLDSLDTPACQLQKLHSLEWTYSKDVEFSTRKANEWAGLTLYRTADSYYTLLKGSDKIVLSKCVAGERSLIAEMPYSRKSVRLGISADSMDVYFYVNGKPIGGTQSMRPLCDDGKYNKFNGLGVGIYATSSGKPSSAKAVFRPVD